MFQTQGSIFRKVAVYIAMVWCVLHVEIIKKAFIRYLSIKYLSFLKYIYMNIQHSS
jgi:hypothetical protein